MLTAATPYVYVVWTEEADNPLGDEDERQYKIFLRRSSDNGNSFGDAKEVYSISHELPLIPQLAAARGHIYLSWVQGDDLLFSRSVDNGVSFQNPVELTIYQDQENGLSSNRFIFRSYHYMTVLEAAAETERGILVAWIDKKENSEEGDYEVSVARSTDSGATFGRALAPSFHPSSVPLLQDQIAVSNNGNVYIAWLNATETNQSITLRTITMNGDIFDARVSEKDISGSPSTPVLAAHGQKVHAIWMNSSLDNAYDETPYFQSVFHASSDDGGKTFADPSKIEGIVSVPELGNLATIMGAASIAGLIGWAKSSGRMKI
jgi:hypothetical protein